MQTKGARQAMLAGIDAKNAAINQMLNMRQSYNSVPTGGLSGQLYNQAQNNVRQQGNAGMAQGLMGAAGYGLGLIQKFAQGNKPQPGGY